MVQTLYGLIAITLAMMLALNLMRTVTGTQRKMILNEVAMQVTGISVDIMEHLANKSFDENTVETGVDLSNLPLVTSANQLTNPGGFGYNQDGGLCDAPNFFYDPDCDDIDDFHGLTLNRTVNGIPYTAEIMVRYVEEDNPSLPAPDHTFAKEVTVKITSPYLLIGNDPIEATFSRVFAYNRITS